MRISDLISDVCSSDLAALFGRDLLINPFFGVVYVWLWVGLVPLSLIFGSAYQALNPVRTVHLLMSKAAGRDPSTGLLRLPGWVGLWPAALGLFEVGRASWRERGLPEV